MDEKALFSQGSRNIGLITLLMVFWLLISVLRASAITHRDRDRYALPMTKIYIESCTRAALVLHPGAIEAQRMLHRKGNLLVRYLMVSNDGSGWAVLCDGSTGKIVGEQKLLDEVPRQGSREDGKRISGFPSVPESGNGTDKRMFALGQTQIDRLFTTAKVA